VCCPVSEHDGGPWTTDEDPFLGYFVFAKNKWFKLYGEQTAVSDHLAIVPLQSLQDATRHIALLAIL
jgi:hypothetical protein